ncbi:glycerol-3-phosphate responsive antiterminator [Ureibacillus acetophenoni]
MQSKGLPVFIHIEKIGGLALNSEGLEFIANVVKPEGVISTKPGLLKKGTFFRPYLYSAGIYD